MDQLVFATGNPHKIKEVNQILEDQQISVISMADIGCTVELPETQATIQGNALQKARYLYDHYQRDCFAEDTGLEIDCLNGEPGVYSARYAGESRDAQANMDLVLKKMENCDDRSARFRTVIALIFRGREYTFEGIIEGTIARHKSGSEGFGYDPVFIPEGHTLSFAEMEASRKNAISHRARAMAGMRTFFEQQKNK